MRLTVEGYREGRELACTCDTSGVEGGRKLRLKGSGERQVEGRAAGRSQAPRLTNSCSSLPSGILGKKDNKEVKKCNSFARLCKNKALVKNSARSRDSVLT